MQNPYRDADRAFIERVCRLRAAFRQGDTSFLDLTRSSGFGERRDELRPVHLAAFLRAHPECIEEWSHYSDDKRTSSGYYLRLPASVGLFVTDPRGTRETAYADSAAACAAFIVAELGSIMGSDAG